MDDLSFPSRLFETRFEPTGNTKCEQLFHPPLDWGDQEYIKRWWPGYVECVTVWESLEDGVPYLLCDVCSLYYIKHTLASI